MPDVKKFPAKRDQWFQASRLPLILSAALLLAGCLATVPEGVTALSKLASIPDKEVPPIPPVGLTTAPDQKAETPGVTTETKRAEPRVQTEVAKPTFDIKAAELDLTSPDGSACKAVSDGGVVSNAMLLTQIGMGLTLARVAEGGRYDLNAVQSSLDAVKPRLKEFSRRVVWLPLEAENIIGQQFLTLGDYSPWQPVNPTQRRFVQSVLTPMFNQLADYSRQELKSPLSFELRLFLDSRRLSPEMLPGGRLMVPSGMVALLAAEADSTKAEQVLEFQLAHEFSHALRRHTTKQLQARLVDGILLAEVFQKQFRGTSQQLRSLSGSNIEQVFNLSAQGIGQVLGAVCAGGRIFNAFDQTQELEADTCGALLLHRLSSGRGSNFNPVAGYFQYQQLVSQRLGSSALMGDMASPALTDRFCVGAAQHPAPAEREANLIRYWRVLQERRTDQGSKKPPGSTARQN
jgi:hypothetical protein